MFNDRQLTTIYGILNKAIRQAIGLLPNFPAEGVQRPLKEAGLGLSPMRDRAAQMGIEHLTRVMNKDTERGITAHAHVYRLLSQLNHWPHEALESNPQNLPTLGILRLASAKPGLGFDRFTSLQHENYIATSIRESSKAVDNTRHEMRTTLHGQVGTKEHDNTANQYNTKKNCSNTLPHFGN